jgi:mono/diheme cytochrome c family protein
LTNSLEVMMRVAQRRFLLPSACFAAAIAFAACTQQATAPAAAPEPTPEQAKAAQVERGRMLISGGGCHDCHTPKKFDGGAPAPDLSRALSGHPESAGVPQPYKQGAEKVWTTHTNDHLTAWSGAWGVSFAANLTPDQNTGLGIWTEQMFVDAIKQGKHMGTSRPILPPMPWAEYRHLPDEDLKAMFAYLKTLPPIANRVPTPLDPTGKSIDDIQ